MILKTQTNYPQAQIFLVKLHSDSNPRQGRIFGRLEHLASGHLCHFNTGEELLAQLIAAAERLAPAAGE